MISLPYLLVVAVIFPAQFALSAEKVQLDVYYESQCPACHEFFINQLRPVSKELYKYVETNLVPYGNAKTIRDGDKVTFNCQHGESECLLNNIHACALARVKGTNLKRVLLATCLFVHNEEPRLAAKICSRKYGLKWSEVQACATGSEAIVLEDRYGNETSSLNPPHRFVPTTAINKNRGDDDFQREIASDLKKVICNTLAKENVTPSACNE